MRRRIVFDLLFLVAASWGSAILLAIGIDKLGYALIPSIVLGLVLLFAGTFIGIFTIGRGENQAGAAAVHKAWLFVAAFAVSLSCALLLVGLFTALQYSKPQTSTVPIILSLTLLPVAAIVAAAIMMLRPNMALSSPSVTEPVSTESNPMITIEQVVSNDPNEVCPLDRMRPSQDHHVMIHCPHCKTKFCSKHLEEWSFKCHKCGRKIPFEHEIRLLILKRR